MDKEELLTWIGILLYLWVSSGDIWHDTQLSNFNISGAKFNLKYLDKNEIKYVGINIIVHAYHI